MQADIEGGFFRIEKYTREVPTDVIPYTGLSVSLELAILDALRSIHRR
jgi:hypothetical protein